MTRLTAIQVPSSRFGTYSVISRIGVGGQAEVFLAETADSSGEVVQVALKLGRPGTPEDFFVFEGDLMNLLEHPNLVKLYEVGSTHGRPFLAMEYFIGGDLRAVMDAQKKKLKGMPMGIVLHVALEVLRALSYVHAAKTRTGKPLNLVHSDISPSNVFFGADGAVKLGDFGVASSSHQASGAAAGFTAGKLSYLSPEQARGEVATAASDLWAVGVMLYELVVGYHPFRELNDAEEKTLSRIRSARVEVPEYVDPPMAEVLRKALSLDAKSRYRTPGEFAGPLLTIGLDTQALPTQPQLQEWLESTIGLLA